VYRFLHVCFFNNKENLITQWLHWFVSFKIALFSRLPNFFSIYFSNLSGYHKRDLVVNFFLQIIASISGHLFTLLKCTQNLDKIIHLTKRSFLSKTETSVVEVFPFKPFLDGYNNYAICRCVMQNDYQHSKSNAFIEVFNNDICVQFIFPCLPSYRLQNSCTRC